MKEVEAEAPLGRRVARAAAWSALAQWLRLGASLVVFAVLARLLGPESLGLMALAGLVNALGYVLVDSSLLESLVQREKLEPGHADAMFWSVAALGGATMLASLTAAGPVASLFGRPEVAFLVMASAPAVLLSALAAVPLALLQRRLRFDLLAASALAGTLLGGSLGLAMALAGFGVWSLVAQQLAAGAAELVILIALARWRPGFAGKRRHLKELAHFNLAMLAIRLLDSCNAQLPRVLLGYGSGAVAVGEFAFARRFVDLLSSVLIHPVARVALPAFSQARQDARQTRRYLKLGLWMSSLVTYPVFLGLALVAPAAVLLVFGADWASAGLLVQLLALAALRKGPAALNNALLRAFGAPRLQALSLLFSLLLGALAMLLLMPYGLLGIGAAILLRDLALWPLSLLFVARLSHVAIRDQLSACRVPAIASLAMAAAVLLWKTAVGIDDWLSLLSVVLLGACIYGAAVLFLDRSRLREMLAILRGLGTPRAAAGPAEGALLP